MLKFKESGYLESLKLGFLRLRLRLLRLFLFFFILSYWVLFFNIIVVYVCSNFEIFLILKREVFREFKKKSIIKSRFDKISNYIFFRLIVKDSRIDIVLCRDKIRWVMCFLR